MACPYCNQLRQPRLSLIDTKILCTSPNCTPETLTAGTEIPSPILENDEYLQAYKRNFRHIGRGLKLLGRIQSIYNVRLDNIDGRDVDETVEAIRTIHSNQISVYKMAVSYGRLMQGTDSDSGKTRTSYFHPSANNSSIFSEQHLLNPSPYVTIENDADLEKAISILEDRIHEDTYRIDTKWKVVGNVNVNITILRTTPHLLIGQLHSVPSFMKYRGMKHFHRDPKTKQVYKDNLCFFRCLSHHLHGTASRAEELLHKIYPNEKKETFKGLPLADIPLVEDVFKIEIRMFQLSLRKNAKSKKEEKKKKRKNNDCIVKSVKKPLKLGSSEKKSVMNINMYKRHSSLIVDMRKYGQVHECQKCHQIFTSHWGLQKHTGIKKDCTRVRFFYKGGVYRNPKSIFQELQEVGVQVPDDLKIYPYKIVFDFESYFNKNGVPIIEDPEIKSEIQASHIPLSASVCSDFPGYESPVCFVKNSNRTDCDLIDRVLQYILCLAQAISAHVYMQYEDIISEVDLLIKEREPIEDAALKACGYPYILKSPLSALKERLVNYISRVPVIGFNSGKYDLNLIKTGFHSFFSKQERKEIKTIKRFNQYIAIYTKDAVFLDMFNYLAPGYSYANYLKAFLKDEFKGHFPYEWMDDIRKLDNKKLPPRRAFYSSLTNKTISLKEYQECRDVWKKEKMRTFRDYLIHYNNKDVVPFVKAIKEHSKFFIERGIDMFKDGLTLPGLTLKFLFQNTQDKTPYVLFGPKDKDIHDLVRKNLVGGPSIIFHRHHVSRETNIRERKFGKEESKKCQHILGVDANSLYLKCMGEEHCAGFYTVRRKEDSFTAHTTQQVSYSATEWLKYKAHVDNVNILHQYNHGDLKIGKKKIPVDGYAPDKKRIYQFHGCYWHGHRCTLTKKLLTTVRGQEWLLERAERTVRISSYLKTLGFTVIEEYECHWEKEKKTKACLNCKDVWSVPKPDNTKKNMSENEIIEGIKNGEIFGMAQVDIHTPENLKEHFSEMTPVFKNTRVKREDVGDHMLDHLLKTNRLKQPQR